MAKQVTINDSKSFIPSGYTNTGTYNFTWANENNAYTDSSSTTYAQLTLASSRNSTRQSQVYIEFDKTNLSSIPSTATINSVTCSIKYYVSSTSYVTALSAQLYSNTTAKGSATTSRPTSATVYNLTTGSWSLSELENVRLYLSATHSASNTNAYVYLFGATLTVNYSYEGTAYEITTTSTTEYATVQPSSQDIPENGSATIVVNTNSFEDIKVSDNGSDVSHLLVRKENNITLESTAVSQTNTGVQNGSDVVANPIGRSAENPITSSTNIYASSNSTGYVEYSFDFSTIPNDAVIDSVDVRVYGKRESTTTDSTHKAEIQLYSGSNTKGSSQEFTSTTMYIMTISDVGTWTRSELLNAKMRFVFAYYGGYVGGITWEVTYHISGADEYYYEYELNNIQTDHNIVVSENIIIPPEEDPEKTYFPITVSNINATTSPYPRGTTRVESGTSETITITPSDPQLTLALDNGVDITSQLVTHGGTIPDPTVATTAPGASYGFVLNSSTGYYTSNNNDVDSSAAVCRVTFNLPVRCLVTIQYLFYITDGEDNYDYGLFGNIDSALNTTNTADSDVYRDLQNQSSSDPQTLTYEIESGEHFIDIKYRKDSSYNYENDNLQWKITSIEPLETNVYYTYDLTNINQEHSLIFVFGDVTYYFVNSSTNSDCTLYPNGQMVQLPGDSYRLTIAPKNSGDTITMTDNNVDVTSQLERKEVTTEKDGQTITVVNYIYRLSDIQATHNLVVSSSLQQLSSSIKLNNQWNEGELKRKQDNRWGTLSYTRIWVHNGTTWIENAQRTITTNGMIFGGALT